MRTFQRIVTLLIVKPFFKLFFKFKTEGQEHLKDLSGPLLIIGNHKFFLDSFALGAALPLFSKIFPLSFMGETKHFNDAGIRFLKKIGLVNLVYFLFGVFPAIRGQGLEIALEAPAEILKKGGTIFMHPEGRVIHEIEIGQFKRGAPALALMTKVKVLPVAFMLEGGRLRKKYFVKFGPIFSLPENLSYEEGADYMRDIVVDLYKGLS